MSVHDTIGTELSSTVSYRFSVCICTRNRPDSLAQALHSVTLSSCPIAQIIVSDDSSNDHTQKMILSRFPHVTYKKGPQLGLGANRNAAVKLVTGTHVLFIDDDAALRPDFFERVQHAYVGLDSNIRDRTIVSGTEFCNGVQIYPPDIGFLGFMDKPRTQESQAQLYTFVINATVFPVGVFRRLGFDENLVYGYEESDFSTRCTVDGFTILLLAAAMNEHYHSPIGRKRNSSFTEASRLYTTFKRYLFVRREPLKAFVYVPYALAHLAAHNFLHDQLAGLGSALRSGTIAAGYSWRYFRQETDRAPIA
jgi:glycosyltransferase involved in cell wall biosynthesis